MGIVMGYGTYRTTQACPSPSGFIVEHYVPFSRRMHPSAGIVFTAQTLVKCADLKVVNIDSNGFVFGVTVTADTGTYSVEFAWETKGGADQGGGALKHKMKDAIKVSKELGT